jgi:hypothetical protein
MSIGLLIALLTSFIALVALVVSVIAFFTTKRSYIQERINKLTDRLYEIDKMVLGSPALQKFIYDHNNAKPGFFSSDTPHDELYFQVKTFIYYQLNCMDEMFCTVEGNKALEKAFEFNDWKEYIIRKLRHPLLKELFTRERSSWGKKFQDFFDKNLSRINEAYDPEMY